MQRATEYPYKTLTKYPGMRPRDVAIWDTFLLNHPGRFFRVWYDVHMGDPVGAEHDHEEMCNNGMYDVSRWCVDVIAEDAEAFYIIEIKPDAKAGALGQALAYKKILDREVGFAKPSHAVVLTDSIGPITLQAAELMGVALITP